MTTQTIAPRLSNTAAAVALGVHPDVAEAAAANLAANNVTFLVVSGKMASGKDTVALAVMDALGIDAADRHHHYYANALKDEVDAMLAHMAIFTATHPGLGRRTAHLLLAEQLVTAFNLSYPDALFYAGDLYTEAVATPGLHARQRTVVMRQALQHHGTNVRRTQNENYWVSAALLPVYADLAAGTSVFVTDARFPNEIESAAELGGFTTRLLISASEQARRIQARDGLGADLSVLTHASETALDDYTGFDLTVNNEGPLTATVVAIAAAYRQR